MSLFGGDSAQESQRTSPSVDSDFSISPIPSPRLDLQPSDAQDHRAQSEQLLERESLSGDQASDEDIFVPDTDERPNRYQGPASNWKYYTRDERSLAASLDVIRAGDLSGHLYNAHAWKARLRRKEGTASSRSWHRKSRWIEKDSEGRKHWYPDNLWSAWPLEPDIVPRDGESFGAPRRTEDYIYRLEEQKRPRQRLEEELQATVLRLAKEKFHARPEHERSHTRPHKSVDHSDPSRRRSSRSRSLSRNRKSADDDRPYGDDDYLKSEEAMQTDDEDLIALSAQPVMSADEDMLRTLLQPSVRSILTKVDDLLLALHTNKDAHHMNAKNGDSVSGASSRSVSRSRSRSRSARRATKQSTKRRHQQDDNSPVNDEVYATDYSRNILSGGRSPEILSFDGPRDRSQSVTSSQSDRSGNGSHNLNPRDWSEVLGIAALKGWDKEVLERAATRCAALFGEGASFRLFFDQQGQETNASRICSTNPDQALLLDTSANTDATSGPEAQGYRCPEEDCWRHQKPFLLTQGYRFRDHLKRKHHYGAQEVVDIELAMQIGGATTPASRSNPRGWVPPDPIVCPHLDCPRPTTVFPETRRLIDHLKRGHKYDPRRESPPVNSRLRRRSTDDHFEASSPAVPMAAFKADIVGGVHNDGFMQPIEANKGVRGRGRMKGSTPLDAD